MILVAFRGRVRPELIDEIAEVGEEMKALACSIPGFVEYKEFSAPDGESLTLAIFQDDHSLRMWREHPRHQEAMRLGYNRWLSAYDISVCEVTRRYTKEDRQKGIAEGKPVGVVLD
jgi:heme-degrading monooxygenase HmoA